MLLLLLLRIVVHQRRRKAEREANIYIYIPQRDERKEGGRPLTYSVGAIFTPSLVVLLSAIYQNNVVNCTPCAFVVPTTSTYDPLRPTNFTKMR